MTPNTATESRRQRQQAPDARRKYRVHLWDYRRDANGLGSRLYCCTSLSRKRRQRPSAISNFASVFSQSTRAAVQRTVSTKYRRAMN